MSKENLNCVRSSGTCSNGDQRDSLSEPSYSLCFGRRSFIAVAFELRVASEYAIWKLRIFEGMQWNVTYHIPVSPLPPPWHWSPKWARASTLSRLHHHTWTKDSPRRVISPSQRLLRESKQRSHEIDFHASRGIRTRTPSKRATEDPRRRPPGHWECLRFRSMLKSLCLLVENR